MYTLEFSLHLIEILFHSAIKGPYLFLHFLYSETGEQFISSFCMATKNIQKPSLREELELKMEKSSWKLELQC